MDSAAAAECTLFQQCSSHDVGDDVVALADCGGIALRCTQCQGKVDEAHTRPQMRQNGVNSLRSIH